LHPEEHNDGMTKMEIRLDVLVVVGQSQLGHMLVFLNVSIHHVRMRLLRRIGIPLAHVPGRGVVSMCPMRSNEYLTGSMEIRKCMNGNLESLCISVLDKTRHLDGFITKEKSKCVSEILTNHLRLSMPIYPVRNQPMS
jgi:hypothetical protein